MLSTAEKKLRNSAVRNSIYEYLCGTKEIKQEPRKNKRNR